MLRRPVRTPPSDAPVTASDDGADETAADGLAAPVSHEPDLSALPVVGITRRRLAGLLGALLAAWIVVVFARQVGDASAASSRAGDMAASNVALTQQVAALDRELQMIGRQDYIAQEARAYGLGGSHEIAFTLAPDAPPLPADAPGSASVRLGAERTSISPLEHWLTLLFGPSN